MSNDKSRDALSEAPIPQRNYSEEVVKSSSPLDYLLWIIALILFVGALMVNQYLPAYWPPANSIWVRVGVIIACIVVALGLLYATHQGKGFVRLLKDSRIELRRVTWPTKHETVTTSWQVLLVVIVTSIILWCFDYIISWFMKFIIG
ncbi:preprotein translocase subunit SecE [Acinetobacter gerneri]|jgi:preprotein translocase subunit SecE|uniref:Protein translocase subunit SecE n=2 Tax=Acinetobacter gerneri TaxID=202952 RepID=N8Y6H4_9GAMM|nr:preprotein translocase subunit SecE [Acinetobacter gerneri]ENV32362.1 preprotein translocase, SecE subunit [Acinetobacter gerneri DSM 14967 = CIP 107464 = MTCC 9824]EPR85158.1 Preprotein translocase subunit SecE [Acinetobacter gerneri DSM 14967 = CIP 107464 = MTCC 9824]MDQ9011379.1 preprotein translocase subunit SecE [Acinetobacter gerneri]MDQ9015515.1 preprotein translocase subunit SecE [Acinetobacter gerneri]MDQ9026654.1 preprotein translocase subunit SecE [Acinetobacter gerneri]